jgi:CBS domain-containing protein
MRVEDLMKEFPETCEPDTMLSEAARRMQRGNHAFLPVTAGAGSQRLVGVISDGDICMAAQLQGRGLGELRARDVMARNARVCHPGDSFFEAGETMRKARIHGLPVVDESRRLLGVISLADVTHEAEREALSAQITAAQFGLAL